MLTALDGIDLTADVGADGGAPGEEANRLDSLAGGVFVGRRREMDDLKAALEDALDFCRKAGYRPELAWTCCDYSDTLHERDGDGDREKAVSLLDESLAICRELGMRPLMERVLSRREHLRA